MNAVCLPIAISAFSIVNGEHRVGESYVAFLFHERKFITPGGHALTGVLYACVSPAVVEPLILFLICSRFRMKILSVLHHICR